MPELPEVETVRRMLEGRARGRRIVAAEAARDPIVFAGRSSRRVAAALTGRRVTGTGRRGKHFWLELDRRPWPLFHFGMTGWLEAMPEGDSPPRFTKLVFRLDEGTAFAFTDPRRLGRIRLVDDPRRAPPLDALGPDPLLALPSPAAFAAALARRPGKIKAVLLDQGFLAGIGNWMADEVLFQARLSPHRTARGLDAAEAARLRRAIDRVTRRAVDALADAARLPRTWLFHRRWGRKEGAVTIAGDAIRFDTVGGRTTAWVPDRQH